MSFIEEQKWLNVEPVPSWKAPNSIQMSVVSAFFKLSQILRVSILEHAIFILMIKLETLYRGDLTKLESVVECLQALEILSLCF